MRALIERGPAQLELLLVGFRILIAAYFVTLLVSASIIHTPDFSVGFLLPDSRLDYMVFGTTMMAALALSAGLGLRITAIVFAGFVLWSGLFSPDAGTASMQSVAGMMRDMALVSAILLLAKAADIGAAAIGGRGEAIPVRIASIIPLAAIAEVAPPAPVPARPQPMTRPAPVALTPATTIPPVATLLPRARPGADFLEDLPADEAEAMDFAVLELARRRRA